ncbi:unannotated protein [freshwater metagenome]|uniref:Unannotated protein n=1 Tax=freshwater metagenome TaxID=449393 RepID=A0A6J7N7C0_9ZZZZ
MTEGRLLAIEDDNDAFGLLFFQQAEQHRAKTVNRIGYLPTGCSHIGWQSKEGTVCQRVAV